MNFWERIARGHDKLSKFEDATVWKMRAAGESWDAIEQRINAIRQNRALADASDRALREMTALPLEVGGIDRSEATLWRKRASAEVSHGR